MCSSPPLCLFREAALFDMASASSVQVVTVIEPLIQHCSSLFPEGTNTKHWRTPSCDIGIQSLKGYSALLQLGFCNKMSLDGNIITTSQMIGQFKLTVGSYLHLCFSYLLCIVFLLVVNNNYMVEPCLNPTSLAICTKWAQAKLKLCNFS